MPEKKIFRSKKYSLGRILLMEVNIESFVYISMGYVTGRISSYHVFIKTYALFSRYFILILHF